MQAWFLLPVVLLAPDPVVMSRKAVRGVGLLVLAITATVLAASPAIAWVRHQAGDQDQRDDYQLVADAVTRQWREATGRRLTLVRGELNLVDATSFYSPDHPDAAPGYDLTDTPWLAPQRLRSEGWVMICPTTDPTCLLVASNETRIEPGASLRTFSVMRRFWGFGGKPGHFAMLIVPPRGPSERPA